jgi:DNA-binding NarL/FixJ family response regulator
MKRLVVVADNPLIVGAIRSGLRESGTFELLGYADPRKATAAGIMRTGAQVVLVDEADGSDSAIMLIRSLKELDDDVQVIVLTLQMKGEWLERAFQAGANGAMSKSLHPVALSTLLRAAVSGHIVHSPASIRSINRAPVPVATEHSSLTGRELEILQLVASGATNVDIARQLWITQQTVKFHVSNVYRKLDVGNRTEACHYAHVNGLVAQRQARPLAVAGAEVLANAS